MYHRNRLSLCLGDGACGFDIGGRDRVQSTGPRGPALSCRDCQLWFRKDETMSVGQRLTGGRVWLAALLAMFGLLAYVLVAAATASGSSSNLFASVGQNGNLISGGGVSSVSHLGTGQYEVTFSSN